MGAVRKGPVTTASATRSAHTPVRDARRVHQAAVDGREIHRWVRGTSLLIVGEYRRLMRDVAMVTWTPEYRRLTDPQAQVGCELLGATIRRRRHHIAMSQRRLARICGVSQSMISRLENGKLRGINLKKLGRIVAALGGLEIAAPIPKTSPLRCYWD